ncbi:MAG TPA: hypothetical protein VNY36_06270, partial [Bacteroidia bacterium]|nr:hypothetical protein [Bacteroidia bacterium]
MGTFGKILAAVGLGGGAIAGYSYLSGLKRTSKELESAANVGVDSFGLAGMGLKINITIKNPTKTKFKMKSPFVRLMNGKDEITSSQADDKTYPVPAYGQVTLDPVKLTIPALKLLGLGISMLTPQPNGVKLQIVTI